MAGNLWQYVDILRHFPEVEVDGRILIEIDGEYLTREDVVSRWSAHCDEAGERLRPESEAGEASDESPRPSKEDVVRAVKARAKKARRGKAGP